VFIVSPQIRLAGAVSTCLCVAGLGSVLRGKHYKSVAKFITNPLQKIYFLALRTAQLQGTGFLQDQGDGVVVGEDEGGFPGGGVAARCFRARAERGEVVEFVGGVGEVHGEVDAAPDSQ
jgi:hypothetical protein